MVRALLSDEERSIVHSSEDIPIFEFIKSLSPESMNFFYDSIYWKEEYRAHYMNLQQEWVKTEEHLIRNRPFHSLEVCCEELLDDISYNKNNLRFRIFYALKFSERVEKIPGCLEFIQREILYLM